jgi:hypothetical protein
MKTIRDRRIINKTVSGLYHWMNEGPEKMDQGGESS